MRKRILIVDDSSIMRKMVKNTLEKKGHTIVGEAKNGKEAISMYDSLKPDFVTMDVTMREMDGFTAAEAIFKIDRGAKIIFLTNLDEEKYGEDARNRGAIGYVSKHRSSDILKIIENARD